MKRKLVMLLSVVACFLTTEAKVQLPQLFQSGMVLQRGKPIPVWGKADPREKIIIRWQKRQYATVADADGRWRIDLPKMKAGGPFTMMVGDVVLTDVLVDTHGVREDIQPTKWKPLTKENAWGFSALGSFLGLRMQKQTGVPQGIIVNSWGGTPIEAWISADSLQGDYPQLVQKTKLFQNDNYVKAQAQANNEASQQWQKLLDASDPCDSYKTAQFNDNDWQVINQNDWTWRGIGSVWLRQHIYIDKVHAGKPARLLLGTLFDHDITYLNGKQIGHSSTSMVLFTSFPRNRISWPLATTVSRRTPCLRMFFRSAISGRCIWVPRCLLVPVAMCLCRTFPPHFIMLLSILWLLSPSVVLRGIRASRTQEIQLPMPTI